VTIRRCFWWGAPLLAATTAYVFDQSTIMKPSWVISKMWEAFWNKVRYGLSPVSANCGALVVVVLLVILAVLFFAEVRVLTSIDMGDMDTLIGFEIMEVVCHIWRIVDEVG
jgi:hypothetical protein